MSATRRKSIIPQANDRFFRVQLVSRSAQEAGGHAHAALVLNALLDR
jgi:hypothetical protein